MNNLTLTFYTVHCFVRPSHETLFDAVEYIARVAKDRSEDPVSNLRQARDMMSNSMPGVCSVAKGAAQMAHDIIGDVEDDSSRDSYFRFECVGAEYGPSLPYPWEVVNGSGVIRLIVTNSTGCWPEQIPDAASAAGGVVGRATGGVGILLRRGGCSFFQKSETAESLGYGVVLVANRDDEPNVAVPMTAPQNRYQRW